MGGVVGVAMGSLFGIYEAVSTRSFQPRRMAGAAVGSGLVR